MYALGQETKVNGVITASKFLAFDLVELFGNVSVPGVPEILNRETSVAYSEREGAYECQARHVSFRPERCFDEDLFFALKNRLTTGIGSSSRRPLIELVGQHLDRKNILMHVFPPLDDSFLWERKWNGAMALVDHDYLMVVDSSLPGHTAAVIQRSLEYSVTVNPNQPIEARLRIRYDNGAQAQDVICRQVIPELGPCYWNYFRVYVPSMARGIQIPPVPLHEGSMKLIWGYPDANSASVVPKADTGPSRLTELGGYIAVEPQSVTTVPIQYRLPWNIIRSTGTDVYEYRLLIQKQPGVDRDRVSLTVQLPPNAELLSTSPQYTSRRGQSLSFFFTLESDTVVVVSFRINKGD